MTQCKDHRNAWDCHFLYAGRNCFTSVILLPISLGKLLFLVCLLLWAVALFACPGLLCLRHESLEEEEAKVQKHHLENTDDLTRERRKPCLVRNEYLNYFIISFLRKKNTSESNSVLKPPGCEFHNSQIFQLFLFSSHKKQKTGFEQKLLNSRSSSFYQSKQACGLEGCSCSVILGKPQITAKCSFTIVNGKLCLAYPEDLQMLNFTDKVGPSCKNQDFFLIFFTEVIQNSEMPQVLVDMNKSEHLESGQSISPFVGTENIWRSMSLGSHHTVSL